jgi:hypothetical protein
MIAAKPQFARNIMSLQEDILAYSPSSPPPAVADLQLQKGDREKEQLRLAGHPTQAKTPLLEATTSLRGAAVLAGASDRLERVVALA